MPRSDGGREGRHGDDRTDAEDAVDRRVGLKHGLDAVDLFGLVSVETDELGDHLTVEGLFETLAALGQADVGLLLLSAEDLGGTEVVEPQASALTGNVFGLADVRRRTNGLVVVQARVERVDGNTCRHGTLERADQLVRGWQRRSDAVRAFANGGLDVRDHLAGVVVAGHPDTVHADVGAGGVHATLHDRPERTVVRVRDHVEREITALGLLNGFLGVTAGALAGVVVVAAAGGGDENDGEEHCQPTEVLLHGFPLLRVWV